MQKILVLPRERFSGLDGFVPWPHASTLVDSAADFVSWMPRVEAEHSGQLVQPIPCAIFRDSIGRYCLFRQAKQQRSDLDRRFSFIVGGHIDYGCDYKSIDKIFEETVRREVSEELGVDLNCPLAPVGMVVDATSMMASRHIGFVYEAVIEPGIKSLSSDEFSVQSKYNGQFFSIEYLSGLSSKLDPWSHILFHQYLNDGFPMDIGRQSKFFVPTE